MFKVRRNAYRKIPMGATFVEEDGPYELVKIEEVPANALHRVKTYNYTLRKFTPDETVIWEVHNA
jgi:hypothetical protein